MGKEAALTGLTKMLGKGEVFEVGEHKYKVLPLLLKDVPDFLGDNLPISMPMFLLMDTYEDKTARWLEKQVRNEDGTPLTLEMAKEHGWDTADLKACFEKLAGLSG